MPVTQKALFGLINPDGVLLQVLPDDDVERFRSVLAPILLDEGLALLASRPKIPDAEMGAWLRQRAAGYKLVRLG